MEGEKLTIHKNNFWLWDKKKLVGLSPLRNHGERANPKVFYNL